MRLGVDLDGTVADLQQALAREARRLFPSVDPRTLPSSPDPAGRITSGEETDGPFDVSGLSPVQQRELWDAVLAQENFWETLPEIEPGGLARLFDLATARRWEIIFLTSRPESQGDTAQAQSQRWLSAHGFELPSVFVVHGSRGRVADALALDILVDDRVENCVSVALDSEARPILVWRGRPEAAPANPSEVGIGLVDSFGQCIDLLERVDNDGDGVGLMDRVRLLLGLERSREPGRRRVDPA